jgi:hypothetical protein
MTLPSGYNQKRRGPAPPEEPFLASAKVKLCLSYA